MSKQSCGQLCLFDFGAIAQAAIEFATLMQLSLEITDVCLLIAT